MRPSANVRRFASRRRGFTIVEMVVVISLLGILSIGTVSFIRDSTQGYAAASARSELVADARLTMRRLARSVRDALPGSVRVGAGGRCLELVPVAAATRYLSVPIGLADNRVVSYPMDGTPTLVGFRVAVRPDASVYGLGASGPMSGLITGSTLNADNSLQLDLAALHSFPRRRRVSGSTLPSSR